MDIPWAFIDIYRNQTTENYTHPLFASSDPSQVYNVQVTAENKCGKALAGESVNVEVFATPQLVVTPYDACENGSPVDLASQVSVIIPTDQTGMTFKYYTDATASVELPSSEVRRVNLSCLATVGQVGHVEHENSSLGKAGRNRWRGKRPHVRGVAMNPVDHPLGGGEGKSSGGRHPVSPWGQPAKGFKTRRRKETDQFIVQRRKK